MKSLACLIQSHSSISHSIKNVRKGAALVGKRVLITCCTPYQLLVAAQVLYAYYPDCQADLIVTDQMSGSRKGFLP